MKRLLLAGLALVALVSCSLLEPPYGSLVVGVSGSEMSARTVVPDVDMEIATVDIAGAGPGGASFSEEGVPISEATISKSRLALGLWTVTVNAFNAAQEHIGTGTTTVHLEPDVVAAVTVVVKPLAGNGTLAISVSWPPEALADPVLTGYVSRIPHGDPQEISFDAGVNPATRTLDRLAAGYYRLVVRLADGSTHRSGLVEAVRIVAGATTAVDVTLSSNTGGAGVKIIAEMGNPVGVTLTGAEAVVELGMDMTVSAVTDRPVERYAWYLDGEVVAGEVGQYLSIGQDLEAGFYRLDACVESGETAGTASHYFEIRPPAEMTFVNQMRYVSVVSGEPQAVMADDLGEFDAVAESTHTNASGTYTAQAEQTSKLEPQRISVTGGARQRGPFEALEDHQQESESVFRVSFYLNRSADLVLSGRLEAWFDTEGTNVGPARVLLTFEDGTPILDESTSWDGQDMVHVEETFSLTSGYYWLTVTAEASCDYIGGPPGHEVGEGGVSYYSIQLAIAELT